MTEAAALQGSRRGPPGRPVFLTGMMGAGKSTLAPLLAAAWGSPWLDLDRRIERIFGARVGELFAGGEAGFRRCEAAALRALLGEPGVRAHTLVVACGGGVVVDPALRVALAEAGIVVYLELGVDALVRRLSGNAGDAGDGVGAGDGGGAGDGREPDVDRDRPLLAGDRGALRQRVEALLHARAAAYTSAEVVVNGDGAPQDVLHRVLLAIARREPR